MKNWNRAVQRTDGPGQAVRFRPPREDLNAPDLYIPAMSVVTYVLLYGLVLGTQNRFHPERLYYMAIKSLTILLFELAMLKVGGFVLNISHEFAIFDFLAILGYGFVGVIVVLLASLLLGRTGRLVALTYSSISTFFFSVCQIFVSSQFYMCACIYMCVDSKPEAHLPTRFDQHPSVKSAETSNLLFVRCCRHSDRHVLSPYMMKFVTFTMLLCVTIGAFLSLSLLAMLDI